MDIKHSTIYVYTVMGGHAGGAAGAPGPHSGSSVGGIGGMTNGGGIGGRTNKLNAEDERDIAPDVGKSNEGKVIEVTASEGKSMEWIGIGSNDRLCTMDEMDAASATEAKLTATVKDGTDIGLAKEGISIGTAIKCASEPRSNGSCRT